jgi:paraquat-inducible protein A
MRKPNSIRSQRRCRGRVPELLEKELDWIACHDCDLVYRRPEVPPGGSASCRRCGGVLARRKRDSLDRTLALALAGLVLFIVANAFPFLSFRMRGQVTETTLMTGIRGLWEQGMVELSLLVLLTTVLAPLLHLLCLLYLLGPLKLRTRPPAMALVFRFLRRIQVWSMMEVFMLGILVAVVKLADMAEIVPGLALWSFALLILVLAAAAAAFDRDVVWEEAEA